MGSLKEVPTKTIDIILEKFGEIDDERNVEYIYYTMNEIIFLIFCGSLVGCKSYEEIGDFGEMRIEWFRKYLGYKRGMPSHDTLNRVMGLIDTKQLEKVFVELSNYSIKLKEGSVVSIDGKWISKSATIKEQQTKKAQGGKQATQMVNIFCKELNACLASVKVETGKNETSTLDEVFEMLELSDCILTLDAGYCNPEIAKKIVKDAKADYIIGLKGNQKKLLELTEKQFENVEVMSSDEEDSRGHGRIEKRICKVINIKEVRDGLSPAENILFGKWLELKMLIEVEREREIIATGEVVKTKSYYISSRELTAKKTNEIIRDHWGVENNLHWVLDVVFGEDDNTNRTKNSAANFSLIRKLAFNKLKSKTEKAVSINRKMRKALMDLSYLNTILGI